MDEIDWLRSFKKVLIYFTKFFAVFAILLAIPIIIQYINGTNSELFWEEILIIGGIVLIPVLVLIPCYIVLIIIYKIINSGRRVINFDKGYIKDLPKHCSPAICSLIYDLKIDVYKDYTATVLYLCIKKYIDLIKDGNRYKLNVIKEKNSSNLGKCEKYVLDIIKGTNRLDENIFKQKIIEEAQEKELITNEKYSKKYKVVFIWIIVIILLIVTFKINKIVFGILFTILGAVIGALGEFNLENYISIVDTQYKRTKDGKNIAIILSGLKRYIKDYTLIKDKEIDYIEILENYIPYALSLGESDIVEEFIKYNEEYRDLIYNRRRD